MEYPADSFLFLKYGKPDEIWLAGYKGQNASWSR